MLLRFLAQLQLHRSAGRQAAVCKVASRKAAGRRRNGARLGGFARHGALAFESLEGRALLATISNVHLWNDTGVSNTDRITYDPTIGGHVSSTGFGSVRVDFDHNNDGFAEASLNLASFSLFNYNPLAVDSSLEDYSGMFVINYRVVELWSGGSTSPWSSFAMTLDRVAPTAVSFSPAENEMVLPTLDKATITFSEPLKPVQLGSAYVLSNVDQLPPPQTISQPSPSVIQISLTSPLESNDHSTTAYLVEDLAGNPLSPIGSATWRVNAPPQIYFDTPVLSGHNIYTLSGTVTDSDGSVEGLTVTLGGVVNGACLTDIDGDFQIVVQITTSGVVEATTIDDAGAPSNVATEIIDDH